MHIVEENKKSVVTVYCDGYYKATSGGIAAWSWIGFDNHGQRVESHSGCVGRGDSMSGFVAGYAAVIETLQWVKKNQPNTPVVIYMDLELIVNQILGEMKCKNEKLIPLHEKAVKLKAATKAELCWTPGALNKLSKALSRVKYQEELGRN